MWKLIASTALVALLTGCASVTVATYEDADLVFDPVEYFNGSLVAEGVVRGRNGEVSRYFNATIDARWDERGGVLDEVFIWSDGERQTRVWQFERVGESHYRGTAGDVVKPAEMRFAGNAVNMKYVLAVPLDSGRTINVTMDDWLYQVNDQTLINVTEMTKFGFKVGEVVLTMRKN
ncbi:DUF3833 domain-containing protein [Saccharospirillum impatiens]|uniref:DUF3833 domain-containing protein n=1 Tax=Saccharospirillum impatiens TaxID=169438 RepID=UPI00048DFF0B|nr:DUF3833 domain-containing protein [Saccharospirillum impatiens]